MNSYCFLILFPSGQTLTCILVDDDNGIFGVDSNGNVFKATNKTNFETKKTHRITATMTDNGYPPLQVLGLSMHQYPPSISLFINSFNADFI